MESELLSKLMQTTSKRYIPLNVLFELTYNCNLKCCHCYTIKDEKRQELSTEEIKNILDQLADAGALYLTLSGGEVFTRPDFFEIAGHAREKHFAITIFTNGTLITEEIVEEISVLCPLNVGISIHGAFPETHDDIIGVQGSFEKSLNSLRLLRKRGVNTTLKCTLMKQNFKQYPEIIKLAENIGASLSFDPIVTPAIDGCKDNLKYRLITDQLKTIFSDPYLTSLPRGEWVSANGGRGEGVSILCDAGRNFCSISPYGDVYPCVQLLLNAGNVRESPFWEVWNSEQMQDLRNLKNRDLSICSSCKMLSMCNRCPGLALLEEGDLLGPSKVACTIANVMMEK